MTLKTIQPKAPPKCTWVLFSLKPASHAGSVPVFLNVRTGFTQKCPDAHISQRPFQLPMPSTHKPARDSKAELCFELLERKNIKSLLGPEMLPEGLTVPSPCCSPTLCPWSRLGAGWGGPLSLDQAGGAAEAGPWSGHCQAQMENLIYSEGGTSIILLI